MTIVDSELEIIEHLDFDEALPCEARDYDGTPNCDKVAEWRILKGCCGQVILLCDKDAKGVISLREKYINEMHKCNACQTVSVLSKMLFSIERI